jgi:signal transduction histidine kinase
MGDEVMTTSRPGRLASAHESAGRKKTGAEIDASRARIVAAADEARRRLERDLHDGAQQRLVSLALTLRHAEAQARGTPAHQSVAEALAQLQEALAELRDLARGIHPTVLSERGLAPALDVLVARSQVPVELRAPRERVAPAAEAAIYFTVAEALTNVAKHAYANRARVHVDVCDGTLTAEVADDGVGGASVTAGSGLRGLIDRLDALGGTLAVERRRGGGTIIRARVPSQPKSSAQSPTSRATPRQRESETVKAAPGPIGRAFRDLVLLAFLRQRVKTFAPICPHQIEWQA